MFLRVKNKASRIIIFKAVQAAMAKTGKLSKNVILGMFLKQLCDVFPDCLNWYAYEN